jgi:hypothetical protein
MTCTRCGGRGFTVDESGKLRLCGCSRREQYMTYIEPIKAFLSPFAKSATPAELKDCPQAIVKSDMAILGLMKLMARAWYPEPYDITTMETCNEAGFQRHAEFRSVSELAGSRGAFVLDLGFTNRIRARNQGLKDFDTMYLIEFVHEVVARRKGKLAIVLDPRIKTFMTTYAELCDGLGAMGIQYFDGNEFRRFSRIEEAGENREEWWP